MDDFLTKVDVQEDAFNNKRKRRYSSEDEETTINDINHENIEPASKILIEEHPFCMTTLCDEILIEIFLNLDIKSLLAVGQTCNRLHFLIRDNRLWRNVDLTNEQLRLSEIKKRLVRANDQTNSIKIRGLVEQFPLETWKNVTLSESLLQHITETCENLQILELHHCFINTESIDISHYPRKLKKLVFNDCYVRWPNIPPILFTRIDCHLKELEELRIEFCNWFSTHDLVSFSKVINLKRLSIRGCNDLKEFVPYGSIAARCGFKKLEFLDLRETPITDSDLQCFNILSNLKELLIECPPELRFQHQRREPASTNETVNEQPIRQRPVLQRRPRPINSLQPGRFFIVNFLMNNNNNENAPAVPENINRNPVAADPVIPENNQNREENDVAPVNNDEQPNQNNHANIANIHVNVVNQNGRVVQELHELQPGREQEQLEQALRAYVPRRAGGAANGADQNMRHAASIYFAPAKITDRAICSFGTARVPVQQNMICIRAEPRPLDTNIESLTVRHYRYVTDISLQHLVQCAPKLKFLDLTGSGVTGEGVAFFKSEKPECHIISDHFTG